MKEIEALVALAAIPYLGPVKIRLLIERYGSALQALQADAESLSELPGFGQKILTTWKKSLDGQWEENFRLAERLKVKIISYQDPHYPQRLLEIANFPLVLYVWGELLPEDRHSLAIVGSRQVSIYGKEMAEKLAEELAHKGITVVSGLARGADTAAHVGALRTGRTLAVIGSGLSQIYPQENFKLAQAISEKGAVISEFAMQTPPDRKNFPQRNRLLSGLTAGTLLIEAPLKSGAMITMTCGLTQGRPLFAIPGRIDHENFKGNHALIKKKEALLVETVEDILLHLPHLNRFTNPILQKKPGVLLDEEEEKFLHAMPTQEISIEELQLMIQLPIQKISVLLMGLIIKRAIKEYPGKTYKKLY